MITVEKLEKGTYFDDAFKISFRYDPTTVAKVKELAEAVVIRLLLAGKQVRQLLRWRKHRSLVICTVSLWLIWIFQRLETLHLLESVRVSHRSQLFNL